MKYKKIIAMLTMGTLIFAGASGCMTTALAAESAVAEETTLDAVTTLSQIDNTKWNFNEEDNVYWQIGISYCETPASEEYEKLGIFVPAAYMTASDNGDGTYTCQINPDGSVNGYTAETAPIVIPVNTPGYAAMEAPSAYVSGAADYTSAGFIYVNAGCRGRDDGAPAGVTDLKAAVRYIRYNEGNIAGSMDRIFTFGMSGGGAQSALMGATGDSELYTPYLEAIGAVEGVSDAVAGSMCWCPITNLDYADEAYEWNLGSSRSDLDEETQSLSDGMAEAFADYINELGLKDEDGNALVLTESDEGIFQAGSYYEYVKEEIETSLNNFLSDTEFPYTPSSSGAIGGGLGGGAAFGRGDLPDDAELQNDGDLPQRGDFAGKGEHKGRGNFTKDGDLSEDAELPTDGDLPDGAELPTDGDLPDGTELPAEGDLAQGGYVDENGQMQNDGINREITENTATDENATYETAQDYIDSLNADDTWVLYDSETNTATITSVEAFVNHCKTASKSVGAFDDLDATQGENTLFGYADGSGAHFDAVMAELLQDTEYAEAYASDLEKQDALGNTVDYRVNMYNPMYYLCDYYDGYQTSNVAQYWRIRTGINQGDTALSTEINLTLALENYGRDVDFETVWGLGHTMAERSGDSTENFIEWVNECLK
jgi:hypothetical protein